ncbi:3,4-dihydroxy-2-butanone-4-phosphate synthase [Alkalihalobacillus oceani]|uniref:3,4-dihydroxy-2-butanone-4-phosphate synthase n=1 Tax=Halalkalibacter oceani TaxID=1653776 RepID=UPI00203E0632|nr:3,4-dihydroxy-2-butanone-4-phosphate synthase [Halalkalibacter oceani]
MSGPLNDPSGLVLLYDDLTSQLGYLMGAATEVRKEKVNFMAHHGKGLIYVCITESHAKRLNLPLIGGADSLRSDKAFAVSVDYTTSTTGISAFERAETIRAFARAGTKAEDFKRPGHIFPLISSDKGIVTERNICEAAVSLADMLTKEPVAYLCEILDEKGKIASLDRLREMAELHHLPFVTLSDVITWQLEKTNWLDSGERKVMKAANQEIDVYQMTNRLNGSSFTVYLRKTRDKLLRIQVYEQCIWGDLLNENQNCSCKKHFPYYFDELLYGTYSCLIYQRTDERQQLSAEEKRVVIKQLREWVQQADMTQKADQKIKELT